MTDDVFTENHTLSQPVRLLTPDGRRVDHPQFRIDLTDRELRDLYQDLVLLRRFDAEATALQRQGELALWASLLGQEAAQIGAGHALGQNDFAFTSYREHGVAWCRGVAPVDMLQFWRGTAHGAWDPFQYRIANYQVIVGGHALHGVGYAMGMQRDAADGAVLVCFGDGASSQGDVHEAFTFAGVFNAPVVFFCQNNQWAISVPVDRQSRVPLYRRANGFGFPGVRVDGNDVLACLAVTKAALARARAGSGPVLLEAFTYRMAPHTTSDDPSRYRFDGELETWRMLDPIDRLRLYLLRQDIADADFLEEVRARGEDLATRLREDCRALPEPDPLAIFDHVYAEPGPALAIERAAFAAYLNSFDRG